MAFGQHGGTTASKCTKRGLKHELSGLVISCEIVTKSNEESGGFCNLVSILWKFC